MTQADAWPPVGIVVLNWHRRPDTLNCLHALAALDYPNRSVILIDNGCEDFSAAEVSRLLPQAQYIRTETNLGFAAGANLGMRRALDSGAQYVWFLNNDAQPEPHALMELVAAARAEPQPVIVGAKILQAPEARRLDSIALRVDRRSGRVYLIGHDEVDRGQYDQLSEVDAVTGCAMLVSRAACERLGGFDEAFFAYLEDADLCLRARAAGWRVAAAPRARVLHRRAPATQSRQSVSSLYYATRNHLLVMYRHSGRSGWRRHLLLARVVGLNVLYALRGGAGGRLARLRAVWRGTHDYRRGVTGATSS